MLPYSYPDEYRFYPRDEALLAALAESSGGVFDPEMEAIFAADGETVVSPIALWPLPGRFGAAAIPDRPAVERREAF